MGGKCGEVVYLTLREHYITHRILCILYPDNIKLKYAFFMMCIQRKNELGEKVTTSRTYQKARIDWYNYAKEDINSGLFKEGILHPNYGKPPANKGISRSDETKRKISEKNKGKHSNPSTEFKKGQVSAFKGKKHTEETKKKFSDQHTGKSLPPFTEEHKKKISNALKGRKISEEQRKKISESRKGKKLTEEQKQHLRECRKDKPHPMLGKHHTNETKRKISEKLRGKNY